MAVSPITRSASVVKCVAMSAPSRQTCSHGTTSPQMTRPRFDGRLFVGVRTTGIYCRPVCPARTPKREHVTFFPTAAAAQAAGFRPCLRCRPETAPDFAAWRGTSNTVARALALSEHTVNDHVRAVLAKCDAPTRAVLVSRIAGD